MDDNARERRVYAVNLNIELKDYLARGRRGSAAGKTKKCGRFGHVFLELTNNAHTYIYKRINKMFNITQINWQNQ